MLLIVNAIILTSVMSDQLMMTLHVLKLAVHFNGICSNLMHMHACLAGKTDCLMY